MKSHLLLAAVAGAALFCLIPSASADSVRADWNHHVNFSRFHTYSFGKVQVSDPFSADRIKGALHHDLQKKGWTEVPSGGQVTVDVAGGIRDEKQLETYYNGLGGGWGMGWGWGGWGWGPGGFGESTTTTRRIPEDHMVIDMFDSKNKQLIWRGISQGEIRDNPNKNRQMIYQDIHKLLYSFPPKSE